MVVKKEHIDFVIREFNLVDFFLKNIEEGISIYNNHGIIDDIDACTQELIVRYNLSWEKLDEIYDLVRIAFSKAEEIAMNKYNKTVIKLNETQLRKIIRETIINYIH